MCAYCTIDDLRRVLPEKISIGDVNIGTPTPGRQSTKRSSITPQSAAEYVEYAQQEIDSRLRPCYLTPLRRIKSFETYLENSIGAGTNITVTVHDSSVFNLGDLVRFQNINDMETATITSFPSLTTFTVDSLQNPYSDTNGKVAIIKFPNPVPIMTARLACSYLFDRLFVAEQEPDVSNYGKAQRTMAANSMDKILSGEIKLEGQEFTGRRFVRGPLFDAYKSPAEVTIGAEKE